FYFAYRPQKEECGPDGECQMPQSRRTQRIVLWVVTAIAGVLVAFPYLLRYLPV
ncbi:MAG: mercuric transporter MerT family protein, partial [bacterium]